MTVADGSQVRLADVSEVTAGTTPPNPAFQIMRYVSSEVRISKQTDIPNEIRADRNVASIVDVGRSVQGPINTFLSYGTFDTWLQRLLCSTWSGNVLKNGVVQQAATLEFLYEQGAADSYVRYQACRWNTLALTLRARQSVQANWGIMGIRSPDPTNAILAGATYADPTTTPVFNAGLNVSDISFDGLDNAPKVQSLVMNIANNIYQNDVVGRYEPYSHGFGRFEVTGTISTYFENNDAYQAILDHADVGISTTIVDALGNSYVINLPRTKFLDGGPTVGGNGQAVMIEVPFQAYFDVTAGATIVITRSGGGAPAAPSLDFSSSSNSQYIGQVV
ncbi:phage tail tube protein [Rhizobium sp. ZK1]|uniref:phage tail tube protein n=1 Tax=Rhizobium sp. ZK1 TaxID=3389872 RepID=UPI0039F6A5BB